VESPAKPDCEPKKFVRELRDAAGYEIGQQVTVAVLRDVRAVDVTGTSKGRGFAGVIRRHHFSGQRATHGVKKVHRQAGSTGSSADPARIFKGTRMPGQMGAQRVTMRNLRVVRVDLENHLLIVRGAVPGPNGGWLIIRETNKNWKGTAPAK
jgi:large subunit ribosomal protein L3